MLRPLRPAELVGRGFGDQCNVAPTSASHRSVAAHIRADPFGRPCALAETAAGKISQLSHVLGGANCSGRPPKIPIEIKRGVVVLCVAGKYLVTFVLQNLVTFSANDSSS